MLVNEGRCFGKALEQDHVNDVVAHVLGYKFLVSSFSANIAKPGGIKMQLYTDQWWAPEPTRAHRWNPPLIL